MSAAEPQPYRLGIFPHMPLAKLQSVFAPIADDFSKALGRPVLLRTRTTFEKFESELRKETYDIAFIQPFSYVWAHDRYSYLPLARLSNPMKAILVVKRESTLKSIRDLRGLEIANPPRSAAVSNLTSIALLQAGIDPNTGVHRIYAPNHFSCMQKVLLGEAAACGTVSRAMVLFEGKQKSPLFKVLAQTPQVPNSLFVVHSRVPEKDRKRLIHVILSWAATEEGNKLLTNSQLSNFVVVTDDNYDILRHYKISTGP